MPNASTLHPEEGQRNLRANVLIVEDDEYIADLVWRLLRSDGLNGLIAHSGRQALQMFRKDPMAIDLVLLDLLLPDLDGYEICKNLKKISGLKHTPVIIISVKEQIWDIVRGLRVGADDYIVKPFKEAELIARIEAQLRIKRLHDDLLDLASNLMEAQEEEREAISGELYDEIGQALVAVKFNLESIERLLPHSDPQVAARLDQSRRAIDSAVKRIRQISIASGPRLVELLGLRYALIALARRWEKNSGLKIELQVGEPETQIPSEKRNSLYKIISDALTFIAGHGQARRARISLRQIGDSLFLKLTSDAEPSEGSAQGAAELAVIRERASSLGGTFYLGSALRHGSQLVVKVPLK